MVKKLETKKPEAKKAGAAMTEGQRAYEAKRAAKAGMSLDKWLAAKDREREAEERARAKEAAKAAEPPKKPGFFAQTALTTVLAVHADWSMDPRKRWMTLAHPTDGGWRIAAPVPVGRLEDWLARLRVAAGGLAVALGVDLPLGLPRSYAADVQGHADFPAFVRAQIADADFFRVCASLDEVGPHRPFYPARGVAGMTRLAHAQALGFEGASGLSRLCDRATATRPAGAPLFWTLGANQTGKAAITAWRDWLLPALASPEPPRLWPFEGGFHALLGMGGVVVAEAYPAEAMRQRGLKMGGSKRRQADRAALAPALLEAMQAVRAFPDAAMSDCITQGFGADAAGEDRFDSLLGLLGLLAVVDGSQPDFVPDDPWVRRWEGWVLGQTDLPRVAL
eukprot:gene18240-18497_t